MERRKFLQITLAAAVASVFSLRAQADLQPWASRTSTPASGPGQKPARQKPASRLPVMPKGAVNVKAFGARGDGRTNDTDAFTAASQKINDQGGGILWIPPGTYIVGKQTLVGARGQGVSYRPAHIIWINFCTKPVIIMGNHARLRLANGMRFGAFDPVTGAVYHTPDGSTAPADTEADCGAMIELDQNTRVTVQDLELDGNMDHLVLGGYSDFSGYQQNASGIECRLNQKIVIRNVYAHHHGLDGIEISTNGQPPTGLTPHLLEYVTTEYNGRQGMSWVGGIGLTARYCRFNRTGQGRFMSLPGAGVDIEPDGNAFCRNGLFYHCEFIDNATNGMVSNLNAGTGGHSVFQYCLFRGGSRDAVVWPANPAMLFQYCAIHGGVKQPWNVADPNQTTRFFHCLIDDATDLKTGIKPYVGSKLIDGDTSHVIFDHCKIACTRTKCR